MLLMNDFDRNVHADCINCDIELLTLNLYFPPIEKKNIIMQILRTVEPYRVKMVM